MIAQKHLAKLRLRVGSWFAVGELVQAAFMTGLIYLAAKSSIQLQFDFPPLINGSYWLLPPAVAVCLKIRSIRRHRLQMAAHLHRLESRMLKASPRDQIDSIL